MYQCQVLLSIFLGTLDPFFPGTIDPPWSGLPFPGIVKVDLPLQSLLGLHYCQGCQFARVTVSRGVSSLDATTLLFRRVQTHVLR